MSQGGDSSICRHGCCHHQKFIYKYSKDSHVIKKDQNKLKIKSIIDTFEKFNNRKKNKVINNRLGISYTTGVDSLITYKPDHMLENTQDLYIKTFEGWNDRSMKKNYKKKTRKKHILRRERKERQIVSEFRKRHSDNANTSVAPGKDELIQIYKKARYITKNIKVYKWIHHVKLRDVLDIEKYNRDLTEYTPVGMKKYRGKKISNIKKRNVLGNGGTSRNVGNKKVNKRKQKEKLPGSFHGTVY